MTYYLPGKAGSHDFKFGFEDIHDSYHFGINGQSGPYRLYYPAKGAAPNRVRFIDTGLPGDYNSGWTAGANIDQHYSIYAQDRWAFNNRLSLTAGLRYDYQDVGYEDGIRKPEITDVTTALQAGDGGHLPGLVNSDRRIVLQEQQRGRPRRHQLRADGRRQERAEGVLRPLL